MNPQIAYESVQQTLRILIPEFIVLAAGVAMMTAAPFFRWPRRTWCAIGAGALTAALLALLAVSGWQTDMYASVALNDSLGFYGRLVVLLSGLILLALAHDEPADDTAGEFFGAFLMINAGAMLVTTANELVFLFVGLELVSMPTYLLLYLTRRTSTTQETATKYFYLSIFSSGLLLYGLAFLYGVAGVSNLKALATLCRWLVPTRSRTRSLAWSPWCSCWRASVSGSRRSPSTSMLPTSTRDLPRSWPPCCRGCPRVSGSWRWSGRSPR